ncbi:4Fe-4S dicluster domain-containing protein [Chloroflexota bacterium]
MVNTRDQDLALSVRRGRIVCDSTDCTGCTACEAVCSLFHEGVVSPGLSRIQIATWEYEGWRSEIYVCEQCQGAECLAACQWGAMYIDERTGARVIDEKKCNGCKECMEACPCTPSRIRYNEEKIVCVKCDLCGGEPQCVKYCQEGALNFDGG